MSDWLDHCLMRAKKRRRFAHSMMRLAKLDPLPAHWNIEHRNVTEAKEALRDGIKWLQAARAEKLRITHQFEMRETEELSNVHA